MIDDALLIEQVSGFPQLFAKNDRSFKDKRAKMNAWQTIACILESTPELCEQRFVTLRNKYTAIKREVKSTPSGSSATVIHWPHYNAMGFLDPYLHTRRSISNYSQSEQPQSKEWNSFSCITDKNTGSDKENNTSEDERSTGGESYRQNSICIETDSMSCLSNIRKFVEPTQNSTPGPSNMQSSALKRKIPRETIPKTKKDKEVLTEKLSGCFDTLTTVMREKYKKPVHPENSDEHFVKSLVSDLSVFNQKQKIIIKRKIYTILSDYLESE